MIFQGYCISQNSIFDGCIYDNHPNVYLSCDTSLKCIHSKIDEFNCHKDTEKTPLSLLSSFFKNSTSICSVKNETQEVGPFSMVEWFENVNVCLQGKDFLGLAVTDVPVSINICQSLDETFKCLHNSILYFQLVDKELFKSKFASFANQYTRMQRKCDRKESFFVYYVDTCEPVLT